MDIYEGQVKNGAPQGFGRYITGTNNDSFIGYLREPDNTTQGGLVTSKGFGLYFYEDKL